MRFFKDLKISFVMEIRRYYRWKERVIWDILGAIIMFFGFMLVWRAILMGGFEGVGDLTAENYVTFILCGSVLWEVITQSMGWQMVQAFVSDKHRRVLPYIMISPLDKISYLYGKVGVGMVRFLITNTILLAIASLLFNFSFNGSIFLAGLIFVVSFLSFSGIGLILASLAAWREGIGNIGVVVTEILYLMSGVHYPIEVFPKQIKGLVSLLPTTQAIHALRMVGLYGYGVSELSNQLIYLGSLAIIFPILGYIIFTKIKNRAMLIGI